MEPLRQPPGWPPTSLMEAATDGAASSPRKLTRWEYEREMAEDHRLGEAIVEQLAARPARPTWPYDPARQAIADAVAHAVAEEKSIAPPGLHPDDLMELLLWDAFEDWTPIRLYMELRENHAIDLPAPIVLQAVCEHWTLTQFVDWCLREKSGDRTCPSDKG